MGAEKSTQKGGSTKKQAQASGLAFSIEQEKKIEEAFKKMAANGTSIETENELNGFLEFRDEITKGFMQWLQWISSRLEKKNNGQNSKLNLETLNAAVEYMTKQKQEYKCSELSKKAYTSFELLTAFTYSSETWQTVDFDQLKLTKIQCAKLLSYVFSIYGVTNSETPVSSIIATIFRFENDGDSISADKFFFRALAGLQYISRFLLDFWNNRIFKSIQYLELPHLSEPSEILSNEYLPIIHLNNPSVQAAEGLTLLYSSSKSGISFNRLAFSILGYNAPTIILIKHRELNKETNESSTHIIGAFHYEQWYSGLKYQGDAQSYLFSLTPKYQTFYAFDGQGSQNYAYLNNRLIERSKYQVGLGFGGNDDFNQFRLWIDDDFQAKSYVKMDDKTFGKGSIIDSSSSGATTKLDVRCLEIWGVGSKENLQAQLDYRENERREIEKMRKVDKKALWDNGFNQSMMFGKLASYKDQVRGEIERPSDNKDEKK